MSGLFDTVPRFRVYWLHLPVTDEQPWISIGTCGCSWMTTVLKRLAGFPTAVNAKMWISTTCCADEGEMALHIGGTLMQSSTFGVVGSGYELSVWMNM